MRTVEADAIDALMIKAVSMMQGWIESGFLGNIAVRIRKELPALPAGLFGIHRDYFESIRYDVDHGEVKAYELQRVPALFKMQTAARRLSLQRMWSGILQSLCSSREMSRLPEL
jgi:hypothetical protein